VLKPWFRTHCGAKSPTPSSFDAATNREFFNLGRCINPPRITGRA
jgi:hypothetical protein